MYKKTIYLLLITFIFAALESFAQDIPPRPSPPRLVNDLANLLSDREEQALESKLRYFHDSTSNQIAIVTVNSLQGYDANAFAYEIGETWKVGQQEFNNGVVVLVKTKTSPNDRGETAIAVGYGLESVIPDAIAVRIINNELLPAFRNDNFYKGLNDATNVLMLLAAGEISADGYNKESASSPILNFLPFIVILIVILLMRSSRNRTSGVGRSTVPFWTAMLLGSSMGRSHSGSWNNFSGGGSGFGGGSSFGGFGGGGFGGGGASGSW